VCAAIEGFPFQNSFLLWLKYHKATFTQTQINTYPIGVQAVGILANMLAAWHMDATGQRVPMAILACLLQVVVGSMLLVKSLSFAGTFFAFYLAGTAYMVNPLIFGWANIILQRSGDDAVRSVTLYSMNIGSMVLWTFWGILFYSAADAPYWQKGAVALLACCGVMFVYIWVVWKVSHRYTDFVLSRSKYLLCSSSINTRQRSMLLEMKSKAKMEFRRLRNKLESRWRLKYARCTRQRVFRQKNSAHCQDLPSYFSHCSLPH
jgi:hypothetical protein